MPDQASAFLAGLGYHLLFARDGTGLGRPDQFVAEKCIQEDLILVTRNVRHFRALARSRRFRRLSYIGLACDSRIAPARLEQLADVIAFLLVRFDALGLPLNLEITSETFSVKDR